MTFIKSLGPSLVHALLALAIQGLFFLGFSPLIGPKAALMVGAAFVTGGYIVREIEQIYPHFPRFGLKPLPVEERPTATDWMRAARQSMWPSCIVIAVAVLFYLYM